MSDDKFIINVQVGGFPIKLEIPRSEEEAYRKAERMVKDLIALYYERKMQLAYEDILKLVAYHLAVNNVKKEFAEDPAPLSEKIQSLETAIADLLDTD